MNFVCDVSWALAFPQMNSTLFGASWAWVVPQIRMSSVFCASWALAFPQMSSTLCGAFLAWASPLMSSTAYDA